MNHSNEETNDEVDFDALVQDTVRTNGELASLDALYSRTFTLPHWYFVARGTLPNVYPYIASHAEFAGGQPMMRAFTDPERLQRFVEENQLQDAEGGIPALSIPTPEIVAYLESFIEQGVYGIWFNSDAQSYGFFLPLQQLRPVQERLRSLGMI